MSYDPLKVQLVEARLVLAKLRTNKNSALFVMQTLFSHDIAKAEEALQSAKRQNNEQRTNTNNDMRYGMNCKK